MQRVAHPLVVGTLRSIREGLSVLETELATAETPAEAMAVYDTLSAIWADVDRLELVALQRATELIDGPRARR